MHELVGHRGTGIDMTEARHRDPMFNRGLSGMHSDARGTVFLHSLPFTKIIVPDRCLDSLIHLGAALVGRSAIHDIE